MIRNIAILLASLFSLSSAGFARAEEPEMISYKHAVEICKTQTGMDESSCLRPFQSRYLGRIKISEMPEKAAEMCFTRGADLTSIFTCVKLFTGPDSKEYLRTPLKMANFCMETMWGEMSQQGIKTCMDLFKNDRSEDFYDEKLIEFCKVANYRSVSKRECVKALKNTKLTKEIFENLKKCGKGDADVTQKCLWFAVTEAPEELKICREKVKVCSGNPHLSREIKSEVEGKFSEVENDVPAN